MNAGLKYGLLLGTVMVVLLQIAPQPSGAIAFWSIQAVQLGTYTAILWHRTRLVVRTLGGIAATLGSVLLLGLHAAGYRWGAFPTRWAVAAYVLTALVPLSVVAEACFHREEWAASRQRMEGIGLWDMLLLRDVPKRPRCGA